METRYRAFCIVVGTAAGVTGVWNDEQVLTTVIVVMLGLLALLDTWPRHQAEPGS